MGLVAERWTDDRMVDLKVQVEGIDRRMEQGFLEVRKEIGSLRGEMGGLRSDMERQMHGLRDHMDKRLDAVLYALIGLSASMFAAMLGLIAAVILSL